MTDLNTDNLLAIEVAVHFLTIGLFSPLVIPSVLKSLLAIPIITAQNIGPVILFPPTDLRGVRLLVSFYPTVHQITFHSHLRRPNT